MGWVKGKVLVMESLSVRKAVLIQFFPLKFWQTSRLSHFTAGTGHLAYKVFCSNGKNNANFVRNWCTGDQIKYGLNSEYFSSLKMFWDWVPRMDVEICFVYCNTLNQGWASPFDHGLHSAPLGLWRAAFIWIKRKYRAHTCTFYRGCRSIRA